MEHDPAQKPPPRTSRSRNGRDEMNLADFPISVLQRHQAEAPGGGKQDTVVFRSTRYDPRRRQAVPQQVTLTTSSRYGLPTPADEDVILALLCVGKEAHNLTQPKVHFIPHRLFRIMRWSPNSRSYLRLKSVLRRLKALTIIYENAWWDARGKAYEQELATGIVAEYSIVRGRAQQRSDEPPLSWIVWTPRFFESISSGNLKTIDLQRLFELRLPTARRMYRYLDKRLHKATELEMDLRDFACGHIGLNEVNNIAILKQRLAPAIRELEKHRLIEPADAKRRYHKVRAGIWRIRFQRYKGDKQPSPEGEGKPPWQLPAFEEQLIADFYRLWKGSAAHRPSDKQLEQARAIIQRYGQDKAKALIPLVVERLRVKWPDAQTFTAVNSYIDEVAGEYDREQRHHEQRRIDQARQQREQRLAEQHQAARDRFEAQWKPVWEALSATEQQAIRFTVLADEPWLEKLPSVCNFKCLEVLAQQSPGATSQPKN